MAQYHKDVKDAFIEINGMYYPKSMVNPDVVGILHQHVPRDGDIFLTSYPRGGSNWTKAIIWSILHSGEPLFDQAPNDFPHIQSGFHGFHLYDHLPSPRAFKCHLPYRLLPKSNSAKYVCILRNIYDSCISWYKFLDSNHDNFLRLEKYISQEEFVRAFIAGTSPMGNFFEISQSWYERKDDDNVLFLRYEEQIKDKSAGILKIAQFLGNEYYEKLTTSSNMLEKIVKNTSIQTMKEKFTQRIPAIDSKNSEAVPLKNMICQGEIGKGYNALTVEQRKSLRDALREKIQCEELRKILDISE